MSLSCVLYLISSFDLIDPRISNEDTRSQVVQCFHDLQLYANDHWLDHLSALANSPTDSISGGSPMLSLKHGLERLTGRHNELVNTKALNDQDDNYSLSPAKEADWHPLGVSRATRSLLNRVLAYRFKSAESDQIGSYSCMYTESFSLSVLCCTDYALLQPNPVVKMTQRCSRILGPVTKAYRKNWRSTSFLTMQLRMISQSDMALSHTSVATGAVPVLYKASVL